MSTVDDHGDEECELDRMLAKAAKRKAGDEAGDLQKIHAAIAAVRSDAHRIDQKTAELIFDKWRLLHKYIHARPFRLSDQLSRSDQWRAVAHKYAPLGDAELAQWLELQIDVATNRDEGRYDQRIRRDGPCFIIVLDYVGNQKRTALAVLHWAREGATEDGA